MKEQFHDLIEAWESWKHQFLTKLMANPKSTGNKFSNLSEAFTRNRDWSARVISQAKTAENKIW